MHKFDSSVYNFLLLLFLVLYRLALDVCYHFAVVPNYGYMGFESNPDIIIYVFSFLMYLAVLPTLPLRINRLSDFYLLFFVLGFIAPISSFYGLSGYPFFPFFISLIVFFIFYFLTRRSVYKILPEFPILVEGRHLAVVVSVILVVFLVFWYFYSGATRYLNFDITKVYEFREDSAEVANIGLLAYLNSWIYQVINLFLISVCLLKSRYFIFLLLLLVQIFFFAVTGHKSLLFYPFLIFGVFVYFSSRNGSVLIVFVLLFLVMLSAVVLFLFDNIWPLSLLVRRVLFVPSTLTYDYFSFFSVNEMLYWSNSFLSSLLEYPYDKSLPKMIGEYNGTDSGANNGFISSGYAHAGFLGVLTYTVIFSFIVLALEKFSKRLPLWFAIALTVVPLRTAIISSDLFTVLLTHGLLLTLVLVFLYRPGFKRPLQVLEKS